VLNKIRIVSGLLSLVLVVTGVAAYAADDVDTLARDVDRLASVRQVKDLQRSYAHYGQYGLWDEMGSLFTRDASFIRGSENIKGSAAIASWLTKSGGGHHGLAQGALNTEFIDEPLVNLSVDGQSAKARWMSIKLIGDGKGKARIEGGIYENEYVRDGKVWKISIAHYYPQYSGSYETGWINEGGADLPVIPYHFTVDETGVPIPNAVGTAPHSKQSLEQLEHQIGKLNDEDAVRNLQHSYGYYVDRKMWDDVVDLFADDSAVDIHGQSTLRGRDGVRQAMERMGAAGLKQGQLNDHVIFDTLVEINANGYEATTRGIELVMLGNSETEAASWEINIFRNRFIKENGLWKMKELRLYPLMRADYYKGWGSDAVLAQANKELPAFLGVNPATGKSVTAKGLKFLSTSPLTGAATAVKATSPATDRLVEARRKLARSIAYDGTENVSSSYGYYIDDFQWPNMGAIFAENGSKQSPFAGYYMGRKRISLAATTMYGTVAPTTRAGISFHWRIQPVIHVSEDGRSANLRARLFQPRTGKQPAKPGEFYGASLYSGMYPNDQTVIENGIWRLWSLEIDEPYFTQAGWIGGWSKVKPAPAGAPRPPPSPLVARMAPDILMTELGRRAEGFRGGTGETIEWPGILPMWFHYRNPVSGRTPDLYWPDCVPCELRPDMSMTKFGYQLPPSGPGKN
jgi:SnoaL-like domain